MNFDYQKYSKYIEYVNIGIFALAGLLFFRENNNKKYALKNSLYLPQEDFNNNKFEESLFGTYDYDGFYYLAYKYKGTEIDHIVNLYISMALMNSGYYKQAYDYLENITSKNMKKYGDVIGSKIFALKGDVCVELKKYDKAIISYNRAINILKNNYIDNPKYIMKIVLIYEEKKEYKKALEIIEKAIEDYYKSPDINLLKTERKRLKVLLDSTIN